MRSGDVYGLAVRRQDGSIVSCRRSWFSFFSHPFFSLPFIRGFPSLVDTLYNGVGALNQSALLAETQESEKLSKWQLILSMAIAVLVAVVLFVLAPHFLSLLMFFLHAGGNVEGLSFHIWDGFFKACIFFGYLWLISLLPEIKRVLCYHGAEHKSIHAFEKADEVTVAVATQMSRFHPRCGTTFLLFVITLSIVLHAACVPPLITLISPTTEILKHLTTILIKVLLIIPISALSYEMIRYAAKHATGFLSSILRIPGLLLQRLTTIEPSTEHLEVALVSLHVALPAEQKHRIHPVSYTSLS